MNRFNSKSQYRDSLYTTNPILLSVPAPTKKRTAPKNKIKQYGDKGYKPSTGIGVGY